LDEALHHDQDGLAAQKEDLDRREEALRALRGEMRQVEEAARQAGLAAAETRLTIRHLLADVQERHQVDLLAAKAGHLDPDLDQLAAQAELSGLKERLERLGPVNPAAVEEYQALEERRQFLQTQVDDLKASLEDLRQAIRKINKTTIERFLETFHSVADKMAELGPILFGEGAQAELILVNPEDPLESGVDIKVQPAGKKLVSMGLLSGGEKALAAVTLLFAIFLHRPSPFCLLDEVDAPLDEKNVDRFNGLVKEIGRQSQILMITHNRRTMEVAETLHGVTMPEPGVSRLVSVKLDREADKIDELVQTAQA
jgi:chromosome segregation protein